MKRMWISVGILAGILALCTFSLWWQLSTIHNLQNMLEAAQAAVEADDPTAAVKTSAFARECKRAGEQFAFLARHEDACPLQESATLLPTLLETGNKEDYFSEVSRCRFFLEELRREELPLLGNIF